MVVSSQRTPHLKRWSVLDLPLLRAATSWKLEELEVVDPPVKVSLNSVKAHLSGITATLSKGKDS